MSSASESKLLSFMNSHLLAIGIHPLFLSRDKLQYNPLKILCLDNLPELVQNDEGNIQLLLEISA